MARHKAGSDIDALCTKCGFELAHVVVAMVGERVVRVQCKTCGTTHAFRRAVDARAPRAPRPAGSKSSAARSGGISRNEYERLLQGKDVSRARRYRPVERFAAGDVIDHPTFGLGVVNRVLADGKVDVVFQAEMKTLVHARGG